MEMVKINKHIPVLLDCYQGDIFIGTVSNSIELFDFRIQAIEQKLDNCSIRVSKFNTNFEYISEVEKDLVINIKLNGEVDKWFSEYHLEDDDSISVYSETLRMAMKVRRLQKKLNL